MSSAELHAQSILDAEDALILKALIGAEIVVGEYCRACGTPAMWAVHTDITHAITTQKRQMEHGQ